ncbi:uncharacterized protein L969DRAFT_93654 [Mixia osmundae IAM 14324]|uniref:Uncharacterized protein n=1 Tax=Mixia osmundae (strain CBS 9802 / IAM 14324 / JCM 22182 / KY 12970) TaxID=764103 RepID=G7E973_MIXOS|nr:uncharacterized protein L969DRAFT_93654 [Mixia osmundae IAM 14324]KEI39813.1 hypothetical protein L969DRAFT_93654 [Mixia osmundae IAM 14324]GAA99192.1 hypothetical protein E5Q_05884 [Mixia osmundae IAM 14324]
MPLFGSTKQKTNQAGNEAGSFDLSSSLGSDSARSQPAHHRSPSLSSTRSSYSRRLGLRRGSQAKHEDEGIELLDSPTLSLRSKASHVFNDEDEEETELAKDNLAIGSPVLPAPVPLVGEGIRRHRAGPDERGIATLKVTEEGQSDVPDAKQARPDALPAHSKSSRKSRGWFSLSGPKTPMNEEEANLADATPSVDQKTVSAKKKKEAKARQRGLSEVSLGDLQHDDAVT